MTINFLAAFAPMDIIKNENSENSTFNALEVPKSSATTVIEKWSFGFSRTPDQVAISKDGNYIIAVHGKNATLFDKSSNTTLWEFDSGIDLSKVSISDDGMYMVVGGDSNIFLLNRTIETPKTEMWKYPNSDLGLTYGEIDISGNGQYIVAVNDTGGIGLNHLLLFNTSVSGDKVPLWYYNSGDNFKSVTISKNGQYVAAADGNMDFYFFNTTAPYASKTPEFVDNYNGDWSQYMAMSDNGDYVAFCDEAYELFFYNTTDFQGIPMWNYQADGETKDVDISGDGNYVILANDDSTQGSTDGVISLFNKEILGNKQPIKRLNHTTMWNADEEHYTKSAKFSENGNYIVAGYQATPLGKNYSSVLLHDINGKIWENLNYTTDFDAKSVAISKNGDYFVAAEADSNGNRNNTHLFYHSIPSSPGLIPSSDDDDDDEAVIPFGNYYLIFAVAAMISLIVIVKRNTKRKQTT